MTETNLTLTAACAALERALNGALSLDSFSQRQLSELEGKTLCLSCPQPELQIYFRLGDFVEVLQRNELPTDAEVTGDINAWIQLATASDKPSTLINGDLAIKGDSQLLIEIGKLVEDIDLDWEGYLAQFIGDIPAHLLGKASRTAGDFRKQAQETITRSIDDLLHEELRILPAKIEFENFYAEIRKLEMRLDRADAKIKRLLK